MQNASPHGAMRLRDDAPFTTTHRSFAETRSQAAGRM